MMSWEYIAGFTDGEGYISKPSPTRPRAKAIVIYQHVRARSVLDEMAAYLREYDINCQVYERVTRKSPGVTLTIWDAASIERFLSHALPFLIVKREAALALLPMVQKSIARMKERRRRIERAAAEYLAGAPLTPTCQRIGCEPRSIKKFLEESGWVMPPNWTRERPTRRDAVLIPPLRPYEPRTRTSLYIPLDSEAAN